MPSQAATADPFNVSTQSPTLCTQVILDGHLMDVEWKASAKWDDDYLCRHAVRK